MVNRILVALVALLAIVKAFAPDLQDAGVIGIVVVVAGLAYAALAVNAEEATDYLVVAVAVAIAAKANVLGAIPGIGGQLDAIVDTISMALTAGIITVLAVRTINRVRVEPRSKASAGPAVCDRWSGCISGKDAGQVGVVPEWHASMDPARVGISDPGLPAACAGSRPGSFPL